MKHKFTILLCCLIMAAALTACQNSGALQGRIEHPTTGFLAYSAILQTDNDVRFFQGADSNNMCLWVDACPVVEEVDSDISDNWTYKIVFCDTDDIIIDDSIYYIPPTATSHTVYINEGDNIIQFEDAAYSILPFKAEQNFSFCDSIRNYFKTGSFAMVKVIEAAEDSDNQFVVEALGDFCHSLKTPINQGDTILVTADSADVSGILESYSENNSFCIYFTEVNNTSDGMGVTCFDIVQYDSEHKVVNQIL